MLEVFGMGKNRRNYSKEFKADIVRLIREGGQPVAQVCTKHRLNSSSVYEWLRQAEVDAGQGPAAALTTAERQELSQLRKENRELRRERDFLTEAAAYFAKVKA